MFNRVLVKHWSQLEHAIGRDKVYANILVNATTTASSVTEQALDCNTRLTLIKSPGTIPRNLTCI